MYDVRLTKHAAKDMDDLPDEIGRRIHASLQALVENPRPTGCKKLRGTTDTYRIRIGDYRALYDVDDGRHMVWILRIQHRKDAYRGL